LRAVEEGLPLVRSANTGISGVVDAYGRVAAKLDLGQAGVVDAPLPRAIAPPIYGRIGNWCVLIILIATVLVCAATGFTRTHPKPGI
jgi:apolipoprotein N-acyltransferase